MRTAASATVRMFFSAAHVADRLTRRTGYLPDEP